MQVCVDYQCSRCGAKGRKLWRQYQTFLDHINLLCLACAQAKEKRFISDDSDQLGWLVPAVPVDGEPTFWGYTSVPPDGVRWWHQLPPHLTEQARRAYATLWIHEEPEAA